MEEVGLGQRDAYCQHCFWAFAFSDNKAEPGECRSFPISQCAFFEDGFRPLTLQKLSRGTGGRGPWVGIAGRACKVSIGERAVQEQVPLGM